MFDGRLLSNVFLKNIILPFFYENTTLRLPLQDYNRSSVDQTDPGQARTAPKSIPTVPQEAVNKAPATKDQPHAYLLFIVAWF